MLSLFLEVGARIQKNSGKRIFCAPGEILCWNMVIQEAERNQVVLHSGSVQPDGIIL